MINLLVAASALIISITPQEYEDARAYSEVMCPLHVTKEVYTIEEFMAIMDRRGFTTSQKRVALDLCLSYAEGHSAGIAKAAKALGVPVE